MINSSQTLMYEMTCKLEHKNKKKIVNGHEQQSNKQQKIE